MFKIMVSRSVMEDASYVKHLFFVFRKRKGFFRAFFQIFKKDEKELRSSKRLILVAEDNELHQKISKLMITQSGHEIILTKNGYDTLEQFKLFKNKIDLILLDAGLPVIDGVEVCREIRRMGFISVPIVFITANIEHFEFEAKEAGANGCFPKPLSKALWDHICDRWLKDKEQKNEHR